MYLSIRDIRFARGRFALVGSVVGLITLLLVLLTGLTNGLGQQNTSALERLDAERFVFSAPADGSGRPSFTESGITGKQLRSWQRLTGATVERFGVTQSRAEGARGVSGVAVLGLEPHTTLARNLRALQGSTHPMPGQAVLSASVARDLGISVGGSVRLASSDLVVAGITAEEYYSHIPVVWASMADFSAIAHLPGGVVATALALPTRVGVSDAASVDRAVKTITTDTKGAFAALPAYQSERGSLLMMQALLYAISGLVVLSFLTVWTIQRTRDIAVLRALGSSRGYLMRDAVTQALVVLLFGVLAGGLTGLVGGLAAGTAVPFTLNASTVLLPVMGVLGLGLAGALLANRRVSSVDPLLALGGN